MKGAKQGGDLSLRIRAKVPTLMELVLDDVVKRRGVRNNSGPIGRRKGMLYGWDTSVKTKFQGGNDVRVSVQQVQGAQGTEPGSGKER